MPSEEAWTEIVGHAFENGVLDPEGATVQVDAESIAHMVKHRSLMRPEWVLQVVTDPDEIWTHPTGPHKKSYRRQCGYLVVVVVVRKVHAFWRLLSAFPLHPNADWGKIGGTRRWQRNANGGDLL